ncbi:hypothetical protein [Virgibacillus ainsalahensis]
MTERGRKAVIRSLNGLMNDRTRRKNRHSVTHRIDERPNAEAKL